VAFIYQMKLLNLPFFLIQPVFHGRGIVLKSVSVKVPHGYKLFQGIPQDGEENGSFADHFLQIALFEPSVLANDVQLVIQLQILDEFKVSEGEEVIFQIDLIWTEQSCHLVSD